MKHLFKAAIFLLILSGCSTDEGLLCETGPVGFDFEVADQATGENLYEAGVNNDNRISIKNKSGEKVDYSFDSERKIFEVLLGWETKSDVYTVVISEDIEFEIAFSLQRNSGGSCSSTTLKDLQIHGAEFETSSTTGITKFFVTGHR